MGDIPLEVFTWTEVQAHGLAHSQSGASNCGATALLNVLTALDVTVPDIDAAERAVRTNARRYGVAVSEYLAARSVAGCTGENIVGGCDELTRGRVASRFFAFWPPRRVDLHVWLGAWLGQGCSAVATLNTQLMYGADYWHHQMIFGVSRRAGVAVTNGVSLLPFDEIAVGLESPSELRVAARDALRCEPFDAERCDALGDAWAALEVSRQLAALRAGESAAPHVRIPAAYRAGITLFAVEGTPAATALRQAPELPLRDAE